MFGSSCVKKFEKCSKIGTCCVFMSHGNDAPAAGVSKQVTERGKRPLRGA